MSEVHIGESFKGETLFVSAEDRYYECNFHGCEIVFYDKPLVDTGALGNFAGSRLHCNRLMSFDYYLTKRGAEIWV